MRWNIWWPKVCLVCKGTGLWTTVDGTVEYCPTCLGTGKKGVN